MTSFSLECFQNQYLDEGATEVNALVTITASGAAAGSTVTTPGSDAAGRRAEIIMIDASGSMDGARLREARVAAAAAIDCIEDGVRFAIVAGNHAAWRVYPTVPGMALAVSSPAAREEARQAVSRLKASGGTAIGTWIELAAGLFGTEPGINHAILLTDGKDESEQPEDLQRALDAAANVFQCDCRGVGTDWVVSELRLIAAALLGEASIVADPAGLTRDFTETMNRAMDKSVADVRIRLWTPKAAAVRFVKQTAPELDLTPGREPVDEMTADYPTGSWGNEAHDYHIEIAGVIGELGQTKLAGRLTLMVDGQPSGEAKLLAQWTDDLALSTRIVPELAHAQGQAEMAEAIDEGMAARTAGDLDTATSKLSRAVQLAKASGNDAVLNTLSKVVDIEEAATGKIRMRANVSKAAEMEAEIGSTKTNRLRK